MKIRKVIYSFRYIAISNRAASRVNGKEEEIGRAPTESRGARERFDVIGDASCRAQSVLSSVKEGKQRRC